MIGNLPLIISICSRKLLFLRPGLWRSSFRWVDMCIPEYRAAVNIDEDVDIDVDR